MEIACVSVATQYCTAIAERHEIKTLSLTLTLLRTASLARVHTSGYCRRLTGSAKIDVCGIFKSTCDNDNKKQRNKCIRSLGSSRSMITSEIKSECEKCLR